MFCISPSWAWFSSVSSQAVSSEQFFHHEDVVVSVLFRDFCYKSYKVVQFFTAGSWCYFATQFWIIGFHVFTQRIFDKLQVIQVGSRCQPAWGPIFLIQPTVWCWPLKISSSAARCWALWIMQCCLTALSKRFAVHAGHRLKKKTRLAWAGFLRDANRVKSW